MDQQGEARHPSVCWFRGYLSSLYQNTTKEQEEANKIYVKAQSEIDFAKKRTAQTSPALACHLKLKNM